MRMAYGYDLQKDDKYVELVEHSVVSWTVTSGSGFLVNMLSILKYVPEWVPGVDFKRLARNWRTSTVNVLELPWAALKEKYLKGTAPYCCGRALLDENGGANCDQETELTIKQISATMYTAGINFTSSIISSFVLAMTLHPEVQKQAQDEIDRVINLDRLPTFEDRPRLPFLECVIREVYRWNPAAPIAMTHSLMKDDIYEGRFIPAGTIVIPNIWAMCHNPEFYIDHMSFNPGRFFNLSREESKAKDPRNFIFGFGHRTCVGQIFGDNAVYIIVASILACFDICKKAVDAKEGHPKEFPCEVSPRSMMLLRRTAPHT